jgi:hypothetical protein
VFFQYTPNRVLEPKPISGKSSKPAVYTSSPDTATDVADAYLLPSVRLMAIPFFQYFATVLKSELLSHSSPATKMSFPDTAIALALESFEPSVSSASDPFFQ